MRFSLMIVALIGCGSVDAKHHDGGADDSSTNGDSSVDAPICGAPGQTCCANSSCGANLSCTSSDQICRANALFVGAWAGTSGPAYVARGNGTTFTEDMIGLGQVSAIWGTSPSDVWAIGIYNDAGSNAQKSYARHWNGSAWEPSMPFSSDGFVYALWGNATDNYWAFTNGGGAYHWNGSSWGNVTTVDSGQVIIQAWGTSSTNVWAIAGGRVSHWDGSGSWTTTPRADFGVYAKGSITGRKATGDWWSGGLKVNEAPQPPAVLSHATTDSVAPIGDGAECHDVRALWASPDDVWAVTGGLIASGSCTIIPRLIHYTNNAWTEVAGAVAAVRSPFAMWGTTSKDIYLSGKDTSNNAVLFHYTGSGAWTGSYTSTLANLGPIWGAEGPN